ncbi:MAG: ECF transporter S component [Oscillospiraceae bacterium]
MNVKKLSLSGICLATALFLPFLTGQIPNVGSMLCPMHLPVLLCGFLCGWPYGLAVGFIAPLLRFVLFGMPPLFPVGIAMAFELATYGACSGLFYRLLPKKNSMVYVSLLLAMLAGRIVWGLVQSVLLGFAKFTWGAFLAGAFVTALPGIVLQIVLIPLILLSLRKAKLITND